MLLIQEINYEHNINAVITIRDIRLLFVCVSLCSCGGVGGFGSDRRGVLIRCQGEERAVLVNYWNELNNNDQYTRYKIIIHVFL